MNNPPCIICGALASTWRPFMPYQTYPARIAWLCADHVAVSREAFRQACLVQPENADIAGYEARNFKAIEDERRKSEGQAKRGRKVSNPSNMPVELTNLHQDERNGAKTTLDTSGASNAPECKRERVSQARREAAVKRWARDQEGAR